MKNRLRRVYSHWTLNRSSSDSTDSLTTLDPPPSTPDPSYSAGLLALEPHPGSLVQLGAIAFTNPQYEQLSPRATDDLSSHGFRERHDSKCNGSQSPKACAVDDQHLATVTSIRCGNAAFQPLARSHVPLNASAPPSIGPAALGVSGPPLSGMALQDRMPGGRSASSPAAPTLLTACEPRVVPRKASADGNIPQPLRRPPPIPNTQRKETADYIQRLGEGYRCGSTIVQKEVAVILEELCLKIDHLERRLDGMAGNV